MSTHMPFRAVHERRSLDRVGLEAAVVGTVDTSVLFFLSPATQNFGVPNTWPANVGTDVFWATSTIPDALTTAQSGTRIKLARRGQYIVTFSIEVTTAVVAGYSLDAPAATLLAANSPLNTQAGIRQGMAATVAAASFPITCSGDVDISDALAGNPSAGIVRFHATQPNEGGPISTADVTVATARYTIVYKGDLMGA